MNRSQELSLFNRLVGPKRNKCLKQGRISLDKEKSVLNLRKNQMKAKSKILRNLKDLNLEGVEW